MTIGDVLGSKLGHVPVRETVLRTHLITKEHDDVFARVDECVTRYVDDKAKDLGGTVYGNDRYSRRKGGRALTFQRRPQSLVFTLEDPDATDPTRLWVVDASVVGRDRFGAVDLRLSLERPYHQPHAARLVPASPRVLRTIADAVGFEDVADLLSTPQTIADQRDPAFEAFVELVASPRRSLAVLAISEPLQIPEPTIAQLARGLFGVAHVVRIGPEASWELSRRFGKTASVFMGAIRIMPPGWAWERDPRESPLMLPDAVRFSEQREPGSVLARLSRHVCAITTASFERLAPAAAIELAPTPSSPVAAAAPETATVPTVTQIVEPPTATNVDRETIERLAAEMERANETIRGLRSEVADQRERIELEEQYRLQLEADHARVTRELEMLKGTGTALPDGLGPDAAPTLAALGKLITEILALGRATEDARRLAQEAFSEEQRLREQLRASYSVVEAPEGERGTAQQRTPFPESHDDDDLATWIEERYGETVVLSSRARRSWKKAANAPYDDREHIADVFDLIAGPYREMLTSVPGARAALKEHADRLRVKTGKAVTDTGAGVAREGEYDFTHEGLSLELHHVRDNGLTFDPRRCLAIYFAVDERGRVILADLPRHLTTANDHT